MDDELFRRMQLQKSKFKQNHIESRRNHAKQVRQHELDHLKAAGKHAEGVKFIYQTDANGIDHLVHGVVSIDPRLDKNSIERFQGIIRAINAVDNPSGQDLRVREHLEKQLRNLQRAKR